MTVPSFGAALNIWLASDNAAGAGHVFDDDAGISRNMFLEMAADQARIGVVTAAGGEPDDDLNRLAAIEIRHRLLIKSRSGQGLSR